MRRGFGFHDRHSPFRFDPLTLFLGGTVAGAFYDPSDLSTLFQDAAGTVPVTSVGDPVGRILDKSGNGNHATQSSAASRPLWQQSGGLSYLTFDGSNDSLLTNNMNFTGTNAITVFAGAMKNSDSALGMLLETSASSSSNSGTIAMFAPQAGGSANYAFRAVGSLAYSAQAVSASTFPAGTANVLTGLGAIATDTQTLRVNGSQAGTNSVDLGTGNFGNYPLYIGRRNNASLPFNGRLYGLIVLGAAASSWQVQVTEQWMAGKTGLQF